MATGTEILIGMNMLRGSSVCFDAVDKGSMSRSNPTTDNLIAASNTGLSYEVSKSPQPATDPRQAFAKPQPPLHHEGPRNPIAAGCAPAR